MKEKTCVPPAEESFTVIYKKYINFIHMQRAHCFSTFSLHSSKTTATMRTLDFFSPSLWSKKLCRNTKPKRGSLISLWLPSAKKGPRSRRHLCFQEPRKHSRDSPSIHGYSRIGCNKSECLYADRCHKSETFPETYIVCSATLQLALRVHEPKVMVTYIERIFLW